MLNVSNSWDAPTVLPATSPNYNAGRVSGIMTTDWPSGYASMQQWRTAIDFSWSLIPTPLRALSALPNAFGSDRHGPLRANFSGTNTRGKSLAPYQGSAGGVYFGEDAGTYDHPTGDGLWQFGNPGATRRVWTTPDHQLASAALIDDTLLHEYGHHIDATYRVRAGIVPASAPASSRYVTRQSAWVSIWNRVVARGRPQPPGFLQDYGYKNIDEWFAEIFAARVINNMRANEYGAYPDGGRHKPSLIHYLCGGDDQIYADLMALFTSTFPDLGNPSPLEDAFTGWTGMPPEVSPYVNDYIDYVTNSVSDSFVLKTTARTRTETPVTAVQWRRTQANPTGALVWENVPGATSADFTLNASDVGDGNTRWYRARITNAAGTSETGVYRVTVDTTRPTTPPSVTPASPSTLLMSGYEQTTLSVTIGGVPTPRQIQWQRTPAFAPGTFTQTGWETITGAVAASLTFDSSTETPAGYTRGYRALVTSSGGTIASATWAITQVVGSF